MSAFRGWKRFFSVDPPRASLTVECCIRLSDGASARGDLPGDRVKRPSDAGVEGLCWGIAFGFAVSAVCRVAGQLAKKK
ncbi:hypothetical protein [Azotobacter vinelandii]|uniref:hypothetical protein n=1 Tax=Azotobacter vinelandii TaxID=354 RepID=UPI0026657698|nr:hypothetical protein [Azotobacter vinelandii]WKN24176.1 hypothetical protein AVAEIV_002321 [Azotobacter vinelandii]